MIKKKYVSKNIATILSVIAIIVSIFSASYTAFNYYHKRKMLTYDLHKRFISNNLYSLPKRALIDNYKKEMKFYKNNKKLIINIFVEEIYNPEFNIIELSDKNSSVYNDVTELIKLLSSSHENVKKSNNNISSIIGFYNRLGKLLKSDVADKNLSKSLFYNHFALFYNKYFDLCCLFEGSSLENMFYFYVTGLKIPHFKNKFLLSARTYKPNDLPQSYIYYNKNRYKIFNKDYSGILYLEDIWLN